MQGMVKIPRCGKVIAIEAWQRLIWDAVNARLKLYELDR
jgi:hypothetical protein